LAALPKRSLTPANYLVPHDVGTADYLAGRILFTIHERHPSALALQICPDP